MTFWLMMRIAKDFNKKNIILLGAFGIYHKELIYKSAAFTGEYFFHSGWDRYVCALQWQENVDALRLWSQSVYPRARSPET